MPLSTATPENLPDIETLRRLTKSLAMLDAIICPEWLYRYYSYNSKWGDNKEMASMRDGCGDDWFLLFDENGAALKGFAHESSLAKDVSLILRIQQTVPSVFASFLHEPAFTMDRASFCIWRRYTDQKWSVVSPLGGYILPEQDGSAELIGIFDGNPESYKNWATDYYEREISLVAVKAIYEHQPLSEQLIANLNPDISFSGAYTDALEIGYQSAPSK
jgi:hypothetical protein